MSHTRSALAIAALAALAACGDSGEETGGPVVSLTTPCTTDAECVALLDGSSFSASCTIATCVNEACAFDAGDFDGDACDDGDACTLVDTCDNRQCKGVDVVCDDGDFCTRDACDSDTGECVYAVAPFDPCNDAIECTTNDLCDQDGLCVGTATDACECADDLGCVADVTLDKCVGTYTCLPDFTCGVDTSTAVVCDPALDTACKVGECDPVNGDCSQVPRNNGTECTSVDNPCIDEGVCQAGACVGTLTTDCDDGNPCTTDYCEPGSGCVHDPAAGACSDDDPCTVDDECAEGECVGKPKACQDSNECTEGFCNELSGTCVQTPVDGECDDSNACTVGDVCNAGVCAGAPKDCADDNECTKDVCELVAEEAVCKHKPAPGPCEDGNPCTQEDVCIGGNCLGGLQICPCQVDEDCAPYEDNNPCTGTLVCDTSEVITDCVPDPATVISCPGTGNPCSQNLCQPDTGACALSAAPNGAACDDGDACTDIGFCNGGACESLPMPCDDGEACTADVCVDGECVYTFLSLAETFVDASFDAGLPEGWEITTDHATVTWAPAAAWDAGGGGQGMIATGPGDAYDGPVVAVLRSPPFAVYGAVTSLQYAAWIDVAQPFCGTDKLVVAIEAYGAVLIQKQHCDSNGGWVDYQVPLEFFDGQTIRLRFEFVANESGNSGFGAALDDVLVSGVFICDDDDACTVADGCVDGVCTGVPKPCDDLDLCTGDSCEAGTGACVHEDLDVCECTVDADCPGESACLDVSCGPGGLCIEVPLDGACDDEDVCTEGDACVDGACLGTSIACVDDELCTEDGCDPLSGCTFAPISGACDDADPCTVGDACDGGECVGAPKDCTPDYPCATGECVGGDCVLEPQHDGQKVIEQKFDSIGPGKVPAGWIVAAPEGGWGWLTSTAGSASAPNSFSVVVPGEAFGPAVVAATSPLFELPASGGDVLYKISVQIPDGTCDDALIVRIGDQTVASFCGSTAGFETHAADLGAYGGMSLAITFEFVTAGGEPGDFAVRVDDVKVTANHPCDDGDPVTECDFCVLGQCFPGFGCP